MIARLASRTRVRPLVSGLKCQRCFHLQPSEIPDFLSKAGIALASNVRIQETKSNESKHALAVLISADRDPQSQWPVGSGQAAQGKFYGPKVVTAPVSALSQYQSNGEARYFGQGGLGLLKLRKDEPAKVKQLGLFSGTESIPSSDAQALAQNLGQDGGKIIQELWKAFDKHEGLWFSFMIDKSAEKNELCISAPYLEFDDFAVRRQPILKPYFAARPRNPNSARAEDGGLFYVKLSDVKAPTLVKAAPDKNGNEPEGNVGCFGYGAGNAMATMDGLNTAGGRPANFLDGGGGANRVNARLAVETLNRDPAVKAIFVNTFGGITRTDIVSDGIIDAVKGDEITKPIIVRLKGTGCEEGAKVLKASGLEFGFHDDFNEAAAHAVKAASQGHL